MFLVQLLLPLRNNEGKPYAKRIYQELNQLLVDKFGGTTAFSRSPAKGTWVDAQEAQLDDVIVLEVMTASLEKDWWQRLRQKLERQLGQKELVIRAQEIERL